MRCWHAFGEVPSKVPRSCESSRNVSASGPRCARESVRRKPGRSPELIRRGADPAWPFGCRQPLTSITRETAQRALCTLSCPRFFGDLQVAYDPVLGDRDFLRLTLKRCRLSNSPLPQRIAFLGDCLPRLCGIATFTHDLSESVSQLALGSDCYVGAVNDRAEGYKYPPRVQVACTTYRSGTRQIV